ncbi:MAG: ribonuclease P protein component [Halobacteriovoraceae bacterium]|nr:ribonuclease P protein component [Halobacteriovoraceae bacterium]
MKRGPLTKLKDKSDFDYLREGSCRVSSKYLTIYFKKGRKNLTNSRIGLSVSRKVGNAVHRNYCKRVLRELFYKSELVSCSQDILFVVSPKLFKDHVLTNGYKQIELSFKKIEKNLLSQIQQLFI